MQVTLNLQNDAELRAYVKDLIKGQVNSFTRIDMAEMMKEELSRLIEVKAQELIKDKFRTWEFRDTTEKVLRQYLTEAFGRSPNDELRSLAKNVINEMVVGDSLKKMLDEMLNNKLRAILK